MGFSILSIIVGIISMCFVPVGISVDSPGLAILQFILGCILICFGILSFKGQKMQKAKELEKKRLAAEQEAERKKY